MNIFLWRSSQKKNRSIAIKYIVFLLISLFFVISCIHVQPFYANEDIPLSASQNDDELAAIVNPFNSTCYDWRENIIPCDFKGPYAELMFDKSLSDGSSAGDWRLPTMKELCTLIDFSKRDPALPNGHMFSNAPSGYHWSATTLDYYSEMAWIVYIESGTTCYENIKNRSGYILPVRSLKE